MYTLKTGTVHCNEELALHGSNICESLVWLKTKLRSKTVRRCRGTAAYRKRPHISEFRMIPSQGGRRSRKGDLCVVRRAVVDSRLSFLAQSSVMHGCLGFETRCRREKGPGDRERGKHAVPDAVLADPGE
jgi:hypothetical protein